MEYFKLFRKRKNVQNKIDRTVCLDGIPAHVNAENTANEIPSILS